MDNALTFDVEDYFHVEAAVRRVSRREWGGCPSRVEQNTLRILELLDRHQVTATFFVLGWVAERHPGLVREIDARGHEVGCHSYAHGVIYSMRREEFREDTRQAKAVIEDLIGKRVLGYRAPTFSVVASSLWALDILAEEGFSYDSSIFPIHHDRYGIPKAPRFPYRVGAGGSGEFMEFPMTTLEIAGLRLPFAGGGYFRLLPYAAIRAALRRINHGARQPGIVYLHPWEFDPDQPKLLRGVNGLRHSLNLRTTEGKLARLLRDFRFTAARDILYPRTAATVAP